MSETNALMKSEPKQVIVSDIKKIQIKEVESEVQTSQVDVIGDILDNCRWWQLRTILIIFLTKIPTAFFMACIVYTAPIPQRVRVFCKNVSVADELLFHNSSTIVTHPPIVSMDDREFDLTYCDTFADIKEHARKFYGNQKHKMPWIMPNVTEKIDDDSEFNLIPCDVFNFKSGKPVTKYDVICSRGALVVLTQGMHLVGIFLSGIVLRYSLIAISPKNLMGMAMILQIVCGSIAGLVKSFIAHLTFKALAAIGCAVAFGSGAAIFSDITRGKLKVATLVSFDIFWSIGIIMLSFITQYESSWSGLYLVISYPTIIIIVLSIWIPDSPRWLLKHGRIAETEKILVDAANSNAVAAANLPENLTHKLKLYSDNLLQEPPPAAWLQLWQESHKTSWRLIAVHIAFACFTMMFFGMVLNMGNYGRHNLTYSARFIAISEVIGCYMGYLLAVETKHKFQWSGMFNILGAIIAFSVWFWSNREAEFVRNGVLLCFSLVLKASVSCSFGILCACATDLVKKEKKTIFIFSSVLCGRLFLLNAPVVVTLGTFYGEYLPLTLFATIGAIGGFAMIFIDLSMRHTVDQR